MSNPEPSTAEPEQRDPRKCAHVHEDGRQCQGWRAKGGSLCAGHAGLGIAADPRAYAAAAREVAADRREEARKSSQAVLQEEFERQDRAIFRNWCEQATRDWKAAEGIMARLYGKPTERVEVGDVSVDAETLRSPEAREAAKQALLAKHPQLALVLGERQAG